MILTSVALSVAPVFVIALMAISWSCRKGRVKNAINYIKTVFESKVDQAVKGGSVALKIEDPNVNAARLLLKLTQ